MREERVERRERGEREERERGEERRGEERRGERERYRGSEGERESVGGERTEKYKSSLFLLFSSYSFIYTYG
jgi:hypothetical protein